MRRWIATLDALQRLVVISAGSVLHVRRWIATLGALQFLVVMSGRRPIILLDRLEPIRKLRGSLLHARLVDRGNRRNSSAGSHTPATGMLHMPRWIETLDALQRLVVISAGSTLMCASCAKMDCDIGRTAASGGVLHVQRWIATLDALQRLVVISAGSTLV
ncbi:hypothetical protein AB1Y20_002175 [Prymnesium parvum]|uniref:Secreted protein n=1 Tax=Prymnesium parvum TaxID=97485 RepID=A0AB34J9W1_PRYPA